MLIPSHPPTRPLRPLRRAGAVVLLCFGLSVPGTAQQDDVPGRFEVRSASAELVDGVYYLDARVEYRLSSAAREALSAGVPLTIEIQIELLRQRRFLPDGDVAQLSQIYELSYHALSDRYVVVNVNTGEQTTFATLFSALNFLGRITELPIIDAALLEPGKRYSVRIRAALNTIELPGPLRLLTFWRSGWALTSEWYRWPLAAE